MLGLGLVPANFGLGLGISILAVWSPWICPFMNVVCLLFFFIKEIVEICRRVRI